MNKAKIKLCGLFRSCDAESVNEALPDYAGFVFEEKSRRFISEALAKELRKKINPTISTVGVFVNEDPQLIKTLYENGVFSVIQLHGDENEDYIAALRKLLPKAEIWKAFSIHSPPDLLKADRCTADRILLDNGSGTGNCFDWSIIQKFNRQFILAGGLNPQNVRSAIERFDPFAVDISSGIESGGVKDKEKMKAAVKAVKGE